MPISCGSLTVATVPCTTAARANSLVVKAYYNISGSGSLVKLGTGATLDRVKIYAGMASGSVDVILDVPREAVAPLKSKGFQIVNSEAGEQEAIFVNISGIGGFTKGRVAATNGFTRMPPLATSELDIQGMSLNSKGIATAGSQGTAQALTSETPIRSFSGTPGLPSVISARISSSSR